MRETVEYANPETLERGNCWRLSLFGRFKLVDPSGATVTPSTKRVEGVLAVLAVNRECGVPRDEIAEIIWPGRPLDAQRNSFRHALSELRRLLGSEAIEASRSQCRLSPTLSVDCDYERTDLRENGAGFMPEFEGPWFDEVRVESPGGRHNSGETVVGSFLNTLSWFAEFDPKGMFEMLKTSSPLAKGIKYGDMLRLLNDAGRHPDSLGWSDYWRGSSEDDLALCAKLLRSAFAEARKQGDAELASEVCLEIGKVYSRTGRYDEAKQVCALAETIAVQSGSAKTRANAARLKGTVLTHWSDQSTALELLERAEDLTEDTLARAMTRSTRAFYLVSRGLLEKGREVLESPLKISANTGHHALESSVGMTRALLAAYSDRRPTAIRELEKSVSACRRGGFTQLRVYGEELLAKLYRLDGDPGLAANCMQSARDGRAETKMYVTPLEAKRLAAIR